MNKLSSAIKCKNCCEILSSPVLLPCGHSICAHHTNTTDKSIICGKCGIGHTIPKTGFYPNQDLAEVIDSNVDKIDFGNVHYDARKSCERLQKMIDQTNDFLSDPYCVIRTRVGEIRDAVQLGAEKIRVLIDRAIEELLFKLDQYERECEAKANECDVERVLLFLYTKETQTRLNTWSEVLDEVIYNEPTWKVIIRESDEEYRKLQNYVNQFEHKLMLFDRFGEMMKSIEKFFKV